MELSETHIFQPHESWMFISLRVYIYSLLHLRVKLFINNYELFKDVC
jgi:hypothetical protein